AVRKPDRDDGGARDLADAARAGRLEAARCARRIPRVADRAGARERAGARNVGPPRLDVLDRVVRIVAAALGRRARFADRRALCAGIPCAARAGRRDRAVRVRDRLSVARARARGHRPLRGRARRSARVGRRAMTALRRDPSKALLVGFLTLLVVLVIQVAWWVTDHVSYTSAVERRIEALYSADATVVGELLRG